MGLLGIARGSIASQETEAPIVPDYYFKASDIAQSDNTTVSNWNSNTTLGVLSMTATGKFDSGGSLPRYFLNDGGYPYVRVTAASKSRFELPATDYNYVGTGFAIFVVVKFTNNYAYQRIWEMRLGSAGSIFGEYYRSSGSIYSGQFGPVNPLPNTTLNAGSGTTWTSNWYITAMLYDGNKTCKVYNHATNTWLTVSVATLPTNYTNLVISLSDTGTVCDANYREVRIYKRNMNTTEGQAEVNKILALYP